MVSSQYDFEQKKWVRVQPAPRRCFGEGVFARVEKRRRRLIDADDSPYSILNRLSVSAGGKIRPNR